MKRNIKNLAAKKLECERFCSENILLKYLFKTSFKYWGFRSDLKRFRYWKLPDSCIILPDYSSLYKFKLESNGCVFTGHSSSLCLWSGAISCGVYNSFWTQGKLIEHVVIIYIYFKILISMLGKTGSDFLCWQSLKQHLEAKGVAFLPVSSPPVLSPPDDNGTMFMNV